MIGVFSFSADFWYGRIGLKNTFLFIVWLLKTKPRGGCYYFCGLNEWMPWFFLVSIALKYTKSRAVVVDYEGKYWSDSVSSFKSKFSRYYRQLLIRYNKNLKVALLDERIVEAYDSPQINFLPDPAVIKEKLQFSRNNKVQTVFLTFGLQSERKGIRYIEKLISSYEKELHEAMIKVVCIGKLSEETVDISEKLNTLSNESRVFDWINKYVSDEELVKFVSDSDAILLPYTPQFQGSSGVLAHACAWGLPVLSSEHGLIGYRVKTYSLGDSFVADDTSSLYKGLLRVKELVLQDYTATDVYKMGRVRFLENFSEDKHLATLRKILQEIDEIDYSY